MYLEQIKEENCPHCGSITIEEGRSNLHTNGYWNEWRKFQCGLKLEFSPNFMRTTEANYYPCEKSAEEIKKQANRKAFKDKVLNYINKQSVDESYKQSFLDGINYK